MYALLDTLAVRHRIRVPHWLRGILMQLHEMLGVTVGAGIGGALRYVIGGWIAERWGTSFPWHTFAINIGGAFLLGAVMALSVERSVLPASARFFLGVGVLGGFTTFSTLSYESLALIERGLVGQAVGNVLGSVVLGVFAAALGMIVGRAL